MRLPQWLVERLGPLAFAPRLRPLTLGELGERRAAAYLRRHGHKIVAARRRLRYGEIDLVAVDGRTIVFVEVKTRRNSQHSRPAQAVDARRRERLTRAALAFLKTHNLLEYPSRFDIVEVVWPERVASPAITHHRSAFPAVGHGQFFR